MNIYIYIYYNICYASNLTRGINLSNLSNLSDLSDLRNLPKSFSAAPARNKPKRLPRASAPRGYGRLASSGLSGGASWPLLAYPGRPLGQRRPIRGGHLGSKGLSGRLPEQLRPIRGSLLSSQPYQGAPEIGLSPVRGAFLQTHCILGS